MSGAIGMDRQTGAPLGGEAHIAQSIADILTTPLGSCIMRRDYGSALFSLIDAPLNALTLQRIAAACAGAIARWEPRIALKRVAPVIGGAVGTLSLSIEAVRVDMPGAAALTLDIPLV